MLGHKVFLKSSAITQPAGNNAKVQFRRADLVSALGPTNRPLVIDCLTVVCEATVTVAGTAVDGEDVWRALRQVTLTQTDQVVRVAGVDGHALRLAMIDKAGAEAVPEHADLPIAGATAYRWEFPIYLHSPSAFDPDDLAMPAELFQSLEFVGLGTGTDSIGVAGGTITLGTVTWYVLVEGREVPYSLLSPVDVIEVAPFGSLPEIQRLITGRLAQASLYRPGAVGGSTMPNITTVSVDELGRIPYAPADLRGWYQRTRGQVPGFAAANPGVLVRNDPVGQLRAIPIVWTAGSKTTGSLSLENVRIKTIQSSAYTDLAVLTRVCRPWNKDNLRVLEKAHGPGEGWTPKTRGHSAKNPAQWSSVDLGYLPHKSNLPHFRLR